MVREEWRPLLRFLVLASPLGRHGPGRGLGADPGAADLGRLIAVVGRKQATFLVVDAGPDELELVGEWTDSQESFTSGKIGFRMSGSEYAQYDNIVVTAPGAGFAVDAGGKLAVA